jgi:ligand-binding sensor domain-containing protein
VPLLPRFIASVFLVFAATCISLGASAQTPAPHANVPNMAQHATPQREGTVDPDLQAQFTHFRVGNKNVKSIYMDDKVVWVGTSGGVIRYDTRNESYKLFDVKSGLLSNGIFYIGRVKGQIAVGTYGGGLSLLNEADGTWKTYNIPEGLGDAFVYDVVTAPNGDVWIATWSGVNRVRGGQLDDPSKWDLFTVENTNNGLPNDWVYGLAVGRNGDIWLATEGGMARFNNGKWTNWNHARGIGAGYERVKNSIEFKTDPGKVSSHHAKQKEEMGLAGISDAYNPNYVIAMKVDHDGQVWAGTWGGGLSRFDGKRWITYTTNEGLPGNHIFVLHVTPQGQLWIGTNNGLVKWQSGKFSKPLTTADGLFANGVFSMATNRDGAMWLGSFGGVAYLRRPAK